MLSTLNRLATGIILLLALVGCPATPTASITSVTINAGNQTIVLGDTLTLTATVESTGNVSTTITWTSSNTDVATIDVAGRVTGVGTGETIITATSTTDPAKSDASTLTIDPLGKLFWTRQFGTAGIDHAFGIATDANGHVYTTGHTQGTLEGGNAGSDDAYVRSYDRDGNLRWTRQFGTSSSDMANEIATDASGHVYTVGATRGALEGSNAGSGDAFIRSYDTDGNHRWTRQFGTDAYDQANGVTTDVDGNVYVAGYTQGVLEGSNLGIVDAFVRSYDRNGNHRWTRQFGTDGWDIAYGIAADGSGNLYTSGYTEGALEGSNAGSHDAFVRSYDVNGDLRWTRQFGTVSIEEAHGIATDSSGHIYTTGFTQGALEGIGAGGFDAFTRSYTSNGDLRWTRQFGTPSSDFAVGVATDATGHSYTTGRTLGALESSNAASDDAFVRSYDSDGNHRWTRQFGTGSDDAATGIATGANGHVYTTGRTDGALEGSNAGFGDAFIRSYGR